MIAALIQSSVISTARSISIAIITSSGPAHESRRDEEPDRKDEDDQRPRDHAVQAEREVDAPERVDAPRA